MSAKHLARARITITFRAPAENLERFRRAADAAGMMFSPWLQLCAEREIARVAAIQSELDAALPKLVSLLSDEAKAFHVAAVTLNETNGRR